MQLEVESNSNLTDRTGKNENHPSNFSFWNEKWNSEFWIFAPIQIDFHGFLDFSWECSRKTKIPRIPYFWIWISQVLGSVYRIFKAWKWILVGARDVISLLSLCSANAYASAYIVATIFEITGNKSCNSREPVHQLHLETEVMNGKPELNLLPTVIAVSNNWKSNFVCITL